MTDDSCPVSGDAAAEPPDSGAAPDSGTASDLRKVSDSGAGYDSGTAVIEFIFASIVLLIPVVYLMLTISALQAASYATTSAAVSASRIAARDANPSEGRAQAVARMHFADFGLGDVPVTIAYSCAGPCGQAGSSVTAHVETRVSLPGFPLLFGQKHTPRITLHAEHTDVVATTGTS